MNSGEHPSVSVVTPTLRRPNEVRDLLANLGEQTLPLHELILVDGAPPDERATEEVVSSRAEMLPYKCRYLRHGGGTAIQRNVGIDAATGDFVAFIDDDIRLEPTFFEAIASAFRQPADAVGGCGPRGDRTLVASRTVWLRSR